MGDHLTNSCPSFPAYAQQGGPEWRQGAIRAILVSLAARECSRCPETIARFVPDGEYKSFSTRPLGSRKRPLDSCLSLDASAFI